MSFVSRIILAVFVTSIISNPLQADTVTRFRAELTEGFVVLDGGDIQGTGSPSSGVAEFILTQPEGNPAGTTMSYTIQFQNVDLDGLQTPEIEDNITALHIHDVTTCADAFPDCDADIDTAGTVHLLNIYGIPRGGDDADVVPNFAESTITGLWDDSDASPPGTMAPSFPISDPEVLELLFNQEAAIFVHTNQFPRAAAGGLLLVVPEPSCALLLISMLPLCWVRRRASQAV